MKYIDLSLPLYSGMSVYPGDPPVKFENVIKIKDKGYSVTKASLGLHSGTHIDAPSHMIKGAKNLQDFPLSSFCGKAQILTNKDELITTDIVIPVNITITDDLIQKIKKSKVKIVCSAENRSKWSIPQIKKILKSDILFLSKLTNIEKLPNVFILYCFPLLIIGAEASPVRAVAEINDYE